MEQIREYINNIPALKSLAKKSQINPEILAGGIIVVTFLLIQRTALGSFITNVLALLVPVKDTLLSLKSPSPKAAETRKLLIVFVLFGLFVSLESLGVGLIIPLFSIIKILALFWASSSTKNSDFVYDSLFSKVPTEYFQIGNDIEAAVKKAATAAEEKAKIEIENKKK